MTPSAQEDERALLLATSRWLERGLRIGTDDGGFTERITARPALQRMMPMWKDGQDQLHLGLQSRSFLRSLIDLRKL